MRVRPIFSLIGRGDCLKRVDVASALIFDETSESVLMVRNKRGSTSDWSLPGGAVEPRETLEHAAIRETKEEAGVDIEVTGLYSVREAFFTGVGHHALLFTFTASIINGELGSLDPDHEIVEVRWIDISTANFIFSKLSVPMLIVPQSKLPSIYSFHGNV
ncbi:NUDIX hydrolase [Paenibacillus sp. IB182363]|uniref:NUDIX hydrolase n=1 Tax=Paenibacillus oceani TaxID=2772510 RepID=A0A927H167_9BACL|nr:NUDIX hydrolase [Paenibacillus oceani]